MSNEAKWYVLHTYSGYEKMVLESLKQVVENNNLQNQILDIQVPMEQCVEETNGKRKIVLRKTFPCYVFIKLVYSNDIWFRVTNTRGVTGFVGPQGKPLPLTDDEVQKMQLETISDNVAFKIGDTVEVVAGPFVGNVGTIEEICIEKQIAKLEVTFMMREIDIEVSLVQIKKIKSIGEN